MNSVYAQLSKFSNSFLEPKNLIVFCKKHEKLSKLRSKLKYLGLTLGKCSVCHN